MPTSDRQEARSAARNHHERDYIERTIATVRNHRDADNCWPQWANIFADEIERLWAEVDTQTARKNEWFDEASRRGRALAEARDVLEELRGR